MKLYVVIIFVAVLQFAACKTKKEIPTKQECDVLNTVIKEIMAEEKLTEIKVGKEYLKWDPKLDFDFIIEQDLPFKEPPRTQQERLERLKSDHVDPYPMYYVYAFPFTDTLFSKEDRAFMRQQANDERSYEIKCANAKVKLVDNKEKIRDRFVFYKPIFSKDFRYAIIRKFAYHDYDKVTNTNWGELQTIYYRYDSEKKGWIRIFAGGKWM